MGPKGLMVGNLVEYENKNYQMAVISKEGEPGLDTTDFGFAVVEWKDIKPIPLTEDWLLKFGFVLEGQSKQFFYIKDELSLILYTDYVSYFDGDIETKIETVHHMQNLYHALKQKELKIKE